MNITQINEYINELMLNQNNTNDEVLKNITNEVDYLEILFPLIELVNRHNNESLSTLKALLIEKSGIKQAIKEIVHKMALTPGLVINFGTLKTREVFSCGLKQEFEVLNNKKVFNPQEMKINTIFDLASTSKIFTCLAILKLVEDGFLNLEDPVIKYAPDFTNLGNITINDLLKFKTPIRTKVRVDTAKSKEEAERILFSTYPVLEEAPYNAYTDIGAMILRYVIENVSQMPFSAFVEETILKPLGMHNTYLNVPIDKLDMVASENFSTTIDSLGKLSVTTNNIPGTPHDSKAQAMGHHDGIAPGHAGYFSNASDMITLANALCDNTFLNKKTIMTISENEVGKKLNDGDYSWYYGSLVYSKQPTLNKYSVYPKMSGRTFMSPGFAGTCLYVDPLNKITLFLGANRLHDRIYKIHPSQQEKIIIEEETQRPIFILPNETKQIVSINFTLEREKIIQKALDLSLQIKLLETIYNHLDKNKEMSLTLKK